MTLKPQTVADEIHMFLRSRRSVRRFKPDLVPDPVVERILETSTYAPSAHNLQPWRFAVIKGISAKRHLAQALTEKMLADMNAVNAPALEIEKRVKNSLRRLEEAPVVIVLCRDVTAIRRDEQEEETMALQSVAACGLQLLLAAHAEGLAGNWICWPLYAQEAAREALNLPVTWEPQGMFILGYPAGEPREKDLKPLHEIVQYL